MWKTSALFLQIAAATLLPVAGNAASTWTPSQEQISQLERRLILPYGTYPLTEYARYYWGETEKGSNVIRGTLVFGEKIGAFAVKMRPYEAVTDKGCNRVYVLYDVSKQKASAWCDGIG